jgi:hypothetical protein
LCTSCALTCCFFGFSGLDLQGGGVLREVQAPKAGVASVLAVPQVLQHERLGGCHLYVEVRLAQGMAGHGMVAPLRRRGVF